MQTVPPSSAQRAHAPHLIGRQNQMRELDEQLAAVCSGTGRMLFLAGDAGVGKTRLLREWTKQIVARAEIDLVAGSCYDEDPAVPYGPFNDALRFAVRAHGADSVVASAGPLATDLLRLLPELEAHIPTGTALPDPEFHKRRLFEAIARALRPRAGQQAMVVILEDLHWSDQTSQELVRHLAGTIDQSPILIVGSYRSDELHRRHPLTHLIAHLTRERLLREVRLLPLTRDELSHMVESIVGRRLPGRLIDTFHDRTGGNPLFVEEVLTSLLEHDRLQKIVDHGSQGVAIDTLAIPLSVKDSILSRTANLLPTTAEVLNYAAVIGRRFDFDLLLRLTGLAEAALLRAIEDLIDLQLVVEERQEPEDSYSFRHALTREAIYDDLLGREQRIKHREVLRALEAIHEGNQGSVVDQLAYHSLRAREHEQAARYARLAAEQASRMYAHREAVAHYEVALELHPMDDSRGRAELLFKLAEAALPLGDTNLSWRYLREAQELYQDVGDLPRVANISRLLGRLCWDRGEPEEAFRNTQAALELLQAEPVGRELALATAALARLYSLTDRPQDGIAWGEQAITLATDLGDDEVHAHAMNTLGMSLVDLGEIQRGIDALEQSLELAKRTGDLATIMAAFHNLAIIFPALGKFERAAELLREALAFAGQVGWEVRTQQALTNLASIEIHLGNWEVADTILEQALRAPELESATARIGAVSVKALLLFHRGRLDEARASLEHVLREGQHKGMHVIGALLLLADVYVALEDVAQAVDALECAAALAQHEERYCSNVDYHVSRIETHLDAGRLENLPALEAALKAAVSDEGKPLEYARLLYGYGLVATGKGQYVEAATLFRQTVVLLQSMGLRYEEAVARRRLAASLLGANDADTTDQARQELAIARETFSALGAVTGLHTVDDLARRYHILPRHRRATSSEKGGLTRREREVIALVARGLSNREIADQLVISEKTAEHHISNILGKLGFSSRAQAAAYAVEHQMV